MPVNFDVSTPVDGWLARLGRALLQPRCLICGEAGADGHDLCVECQAALPWNRSACARCGLPMPESVEACGRCLKKPPPVDRVFAAFRYGFPVDRLEQRFKFHHDLAAGRELSSAMRTMLHENVVDTERPQALIAIPLHPKRLRERGYNQAIELARPLAKAFAIPLRNDLLHRVRNISPQSRLGALARRRNPRGAFAVTQGEALPAHVVLIDDVMTTGATIYECARALKRAGVIRVDAWVAARVPTR